jgi:DNA-binding transcriptional LysR family regulator
MAIDLTRIDLNLLVVLNQLLLERHVSRAALTLGLTQPAVSNSLRRLRTLLGDELFLRTPQGMVPTPLAERLATPVADALALLHGALNQPTAFAPLLSAQRFTLGLSDIGEIVFLPPLMDRLATHAPGITLSTVRNTAVDLHEAMGSGQVDAAIGLLPQLQAGFFQRRLFSQRYVVLMRQGHRLAKRRLTLAEYSAAEHVVVVAAGTGHGQVDEQLQRAGVARRVRLTVPHFVAVGHILQGTDLLATVPEKLAQRMAAPFGLHALAHPVPLPAVAINLFWHARVHRDPANSWLRAQLVAEFADRPGAA